MKHTLLLLILVCCAVPLTAGATTTTEKVRTLLSGIDSIPTKAQLQSCGHEPVKTLYELAKSPRETRYVRLRATGMIGYFHGQPRVWTYLTALLDNTSGAQQVIALRTIHAAFAKKQPTNTIDVLAAFLLSSRSALRKEAIRTLSLVPTRAALNALAGHSERNSEMSRFLQRRLAQLRTLVKRAK